MNMYQIVDSTTKTVVATGFAKRKDAKPTRDEKNAAANSPDRFIVSRGSDHPHGPSFGFIQPTHKRWL